MRETPIIPIGADPAPVLDPSAIAKFIKKHGKPKAVPVAGKDPPVAVPAALSPNVTALVTGKIAADPAPIAIALPAVLETPPPALPQIKGSIIKTKYKDLYKKNGFSCGDDLADELKAYVTIFEKGKPPYMDEVKLKEVALANSCWKESYDKLNKGQRRMTIGNCLRNKYKNGAKINIGGVILFDEALQEDAD